MYIIISIILVLVGLLLIGAVLIQPGKGDMITGMSGLGGQFNSVLGSRRATDLLSKITWSLAGIIVLLTLVTNLFFVNQQSDQLKAPTEGMNVSQPVAQPTAPAAAPTTPTENTQQNQEQQENK